MEEKPKIKLLFYATDEESEQIKYYKLSFENDKTEPHIINNPEVEYEVPDEAFKFGKDKDIISMELSENPGLGFVYSVIEVQDETARAIFAGITKTLNPAYQSGIIKNIFSPSFRLVHGETKCRKLKGEKIKEIS